MTHYNRHYVAGSKTEAELDADAIRDIKEYCNEKQWDLLVQASGQVLCGEITIDQLNFCFGIAGIEGRPFHAFCRKYCLEQYREWMRQPDQKGPHYTDKDGFRVTDDATRMFAIREEYDVFHDEPGANIDDIACEGTAKKLAEWYGMDWQWSSWGGIDFTFPPRELPSTPPSEQNTTGMD